MIFVVWTEVHVPLQLYIIWCWNRIFIQWQKEKFKAFTGIMPKLKVVFFKWSFKSFLNKSSNTMFVYNRHLFSVLITESSTFLLCSHICTAHALYNIHSKNYVGIEILLILNWKLNQIFVWVYLNYKPLNVCHDKTTYTF